MHQGGTEQLVALAPVCYDGILHFSTRNHGLHATFSCIWTGSVPPIDFMYPNPIDQPPADIHEFVSARKFLFQNA